MKPLVIITYKHGIYEFRHELPKNLRLGSQDIKKYNKKSVYASWNDSAVPSLAVNIKYLLILAEISSKIKIELFPLSAISLEK